MNTQTSLLVLVSSLFASIWSNDHPVVVTEASYELRELQSGATDPDLTLHAPLATGPSNIVRTARELSLPPLPARIGPGSWQAVNHAGTTHNFNVRIDEIHRGAYTDEDFFVHGEGSDRWYFIRLNRTDLIPSVAEGPVLRISIVPGKTLH